MRYNVVWMVMLLGAMMAMTPASQAFFGEKKAEDASPPPAPARAAMSESFADLVETLTPAVVNISTTQKVKNPMMGGLPFDLPPGAEMDPFREFFERFAVPRGGQGSAPQQREVYSLGSGFIIDKAGYVVTNHHVIAEAEEVDVVLHDDTKLSATIIGRDPKTDLALLKVESSRPLPYVKFGNSDTVRVGDWVIAIGNPFGLGGTVTAGIISARARNINAGPFDDFLQTDAAINRGNSGGPMFNTKGEVVGVNSAIFSPSGGNVGIGFAVPSALAEPVLGQLREHGRTRRGWLGVKIQHVTEEIADSLSLPEAVGALVIDVNDGGPAQDAGFLLGDVILSFDGKAIDEMRALPRIVAETEIGKTVEVVILREGKRRTLEVTLGELDESEQQAQADTGSADDGDGKEGEAVQGMRLAPVSTALRSRFGLEKGIKGVVIVGLERGSAAAEAGLRFGDVITQAGGTSVKDVAALRDVLATEKRAGKNYTLLRVTRQGEQLFLPLPVESVEE